MDESVAFENVSPQQAAQWLESTYRHQRPLRQDHVQRLVKEMELGRFTTAEIHFAFTEDGDEELINGQHTLHAIVFSGCAANAVVRRTRGCTVDDIKSMYIHHDQGMRRIFSDSARAFQMDEESGLTFTALNQLVASLKWGKSGYGQSGKVKGGVPIAEQFAEVPKWFREMHLYIDAIKPIPPTLKNSPFHRCILSIAIITFRFQPKKAHDFWTQSVQDDGLRKTDPRKTLNRFLPTISGKWEMPADTSAPEGSMGCSRAWNAFMEGRNLSVINRTLPKVKRGLVLLGTPLDGNQSFSYWPK